MGWKGDGNQKGRRGSGEERFKNTSNAFKRSNRTEPSGSRAPILPALSKRVLRATPGKPLEGRNAQAERKTRVKMKKRNEGTQEGARVAERRYVPRTLLMSHSFC